LLQKRGNNYVIVCGTAGTYLEMGTDGKAIRRYNYGSGLDSVQKLTLSGMYFCGEVLDVDSDTGGYNLQTAFSATLSTPWLYLRD